MDVWKNAVRGWRDRGEPEPASAPTIDIKDKVRAWIDDHWKGEKTCPICRNSRWDIGDVAAELRQLPQEGRFMEESSYPLVVITCGTCGYTFLFNAVVIGLVEGEA